MDFWKKHFGKKLKEARRKKGLSQADLGLALGDHLSVESSSVSRWENGHDLPDDSRLRKLFDVLGVKERYFLELPQSEPGQVPSFNGAVSFLSKFGNLEPDLQKVVLAIVYHDLDYAKDLSPEFQSKFEPLLKVL